MFLLGNSQTATLPRRPPVQQRLETRDRDGHDGSGHFEHTQDVCASVLECSITTSSGSDAATYKQGSPVQCPPSA